MDTWIIYSLNQYGNPKIKQTEVQAYDLIGAAQQSNIPSNEIIAVKHKVIQEVVVGI